MQTLPYRWPTIQDTLWFGPQWRLRFPPVPISHLRVALLVLACFPGLVAYFDVRSSGVNQAVLDADGGYLGGALTPRRYSLTLGPVHHRVEAIGENRGTSQGSAMSS
jgi:hypothetical protein